MKKKIMAVDDDADNNFSLKLRLEHMDSECEVITVDSGKKCIEFLENNEIPDIILLDIMMPEVSGWEIYQKLRENSAWENIPVIFVTASSDELAEKVKEALGDNYIEKPYNIEDVKKRIDELLKR